MIKKRSTQTLPHKIYLITLKRAISQNGNFVFKLFLKKKGGITSGIFLMLLKFGVIVTILFMKLALWFSIEMYKIIMLK